MLEAAGALKVTLVGRTRHLWGTQRQRHVAATALVGGTLPHRRLSFELVGIQPVVRRETERNWIKIVSFRDFRVLKNYQNLRIFGSSKIPKFEDFWIFLDLQKLQNFEIFWSF